MNNIKRKCTENVSTFLNHQGNWSYDDVVEIVLRTAIYEANPLEEEGFTLADVDPHQVVDNLYDAAED